MTVSAIAWMLALPRWIKLAAAGVIVALALLTLHQCAVDRAVEADRAQAGAKALDTARKADEAATGAVAAVQDDVARTNAEASKAAAESDDKLKAGLDSLRQRSSK